MRVFIRSRHSFYAKFDFFYGRQKQLTGFNALQRAQGDATFGLGYETSLLQRKYLSDAQIFGLRQIAFVREPTLFVCVAVAEHARVLAILIFYSAETETRKKTKSKMELK